MCFIGSLVSIFKTWNVLNSEWTLYGLTVSDLSLCLVFFSENNSISVWNNGKGIPVVEHKVEKVYVPALIFGQLLTSSNYDDDQKKVTGKT